MQHCLGELALLAQNAAALGLDGRDSEEHTARTDALQVLGHNVHALGQVLAQVKTLPADIPSHCKMYIHIATECARRLRGGGHGLVSAV
jgi:hypothetical protein